MDGDDRKDDLPGNPGTAEGEAGPSEDDPSVPSAGGPETERDADPEAGHAQSQGG